jgi:hypothetical protein
MQTTRTNTSEPRCDICGHPEGVTDPFTDTPEGATTVHRRCHPDSKPASDPFAGIVDVKTNDPWDAS